MSSLSTKLPWLGCCMLLQHGGALRLPLVASALSVSSYLPPEQPDAESLVTEAENRLLASVNHRLCHILRPLFPPVITRRPGFRPRSYDFSLPHKEDHNYIPRVLYRTVPYCVNISTPLSCFDTMFLFGLFVMHISIYSAF